MIKPRLVYYFFAKNNNNEHAVLLIRKPEVCTEVFQYEVRITNREIYGDFNEKFCLTKLTKKNCFTLVHF